MALTSVLKGTRKFFVAGRMLHPLPFEVGSMVRGLYSVVNRGIRENISSLNRVMIRRPTVQGYLRHRKFSGTALRKWGKLVLGSSYPAMERGWLQS